MSRHRITFLTRPGCELCDKTLPRVRQVSGWLRRELVVKDIADDADLEAEYHLRIPVVLDEQGTVLAEGEIAMWDAIKAVRRG